MTIRDLAHLLLKAPDLDKEVKVSVQSSFPCDITGLCIENGNMILRVSGYNQDAIKVKTEIEVMSPYDQEPQIF